MTNVAEGAKRASGADYARFLNIAQGSLAESETLLEVAKGLGFGDGSALDEVLEELQQLGRMVNHLRRAVLAAQR